MENFTYLSSNQTKSFYCGLVIGYLLIQMILADDQTISQIPIIETDDGQVFFKFFFNNIKLMYIVKL